MLRKVAFLVLLGACAASVRAADPIVLTGAGATFPQPLYQTIIAQFTQRHPNIKINYGGGGSGQGIKGITDGTLAFAGSDAPMSAQELKRAGGADTIIEIPSCAGAVVPAYNVPGVNADLNFTGDVLADIYLGAINNWNDPRIAALNPGVALPNLAITPAWRSDGSGSNFVWTSYLCGQSDDFKGTVGAGKSVHFPLGLGGSGNPGVAAIVKQTPGAIGYIEQNFADMNSIPYGLVRNKSGKFIKASPHSVALAGATAAATVKGILLKANIWNQPGDGVYPIASFTYLIARKDLGTLHARDEAQAVVDFFWFATHDGQTLAPKLYYAALPDAMKPKIEDALSQFTYHNEPIKPQQ